MPRSQGGNKAVQLAVERDLVKNLPAVGFESRAKVVNVHTAQFCHEPVGATGGKTAEPEVINAMLAPAADDVIALGNFLQKQWDVGRIVLQIAVHGDDVFATGMIETGGQG